MTIPNTLAAGAYAVSEIMGRVVGICIIVIAVLLIVKLFRRKK